MSDSFIGPVANSRFGNRLPRRFFSIAAMICGGLLGAWVPQGQSDERESPVDEAKIQRANSSSHEAYLIDVPLPLAGDVDERIREQVQRLMLRRESTSTNSIEFGPSSPKTGGEAANADRTSTDSNQATAPPAGPPSSRERTLVFRFGGKRSASPNAADADQAGEMDFGGGNATAHDGVGSQFERALALARFMTSGELAGWRSVAWLPGDVRGHAVLPVIACEQIVVHPDAVLGEAGIDEPQLDATIRQGYEEIALRRQTIPAPVVLGMLDRNLEIVQVTLVDGGVTYAAVEQAAELERQGKVLATNPMIARGDFGSFTGRELRLKYGWASHVATSEPLLARALNVAPGRLMSGSMAIEGWRAVRAELRGPIHGRNVRRLKMAIDDARRSGANLVLLTIDSAGGSPTDSMDLVQHLLSVDSSEIRVAGYVPRRAAADAALVALACHDLVVSESATIGGPGDATPLAKEMEAVRQSLRDISGQTGRSWSLSYALLQPRVEVQLYEDRETGRREVFCNDEFAEQLDPAQWRPVRPLETNRGLTGQTLGDLQIARRVVATDTELLREYGLKESDVKRIGERWAVSSVERLASQNWFSRTLLFIAFFALISEASTPGLGVPGFVSALCFLLFFWTQFLSGTAEWLEVLLFAGGIAAIMIEVMFLPGFGIFGFGGIVMIFTSILLASQTFVIPRSEGQYEELLSSMLTVLSACGGIVAALVVMRHALPRAPLLRRIMLLPPDKNVLAEREEREETAHRKHLIGQLGRTRTPLVPSGKVLFGNELVDVVSDGDLIPADAEVEVCEVHGNRVVVRAKR